MSKENDEWFYSVALQLAADSARQGHNNLAKELKSIIDEGKSKPELLYQENTTISINQPRGDLAGLLSISYPKTLINDMVLSEEINKRIQRIIIEQQNSLKLRGFGLVPRHKILLIGSSGRFGIHAKSSHMYLYPFNNLQFRGWKFYLKMCSF